MRSRVCGRCGKSYTGARCQDCPRRSKPRTALDEIRSSARWKRAAARARARDGNRCTFGTAPGERYWQGRCPVVERLGVHHVVALEDGGEAYDDENLRTLCGTHHAQLEAERRAA